MKTKYRIVKHFNDSYGAQYKKWYQINYSNIDMLRLRNDMMDVADDLGKYQEKLAYDKNKTVVWQSDQTEVKEKKEDKTLIPTWMRVPLVVLIGWALADVVIDIIEFIRHHL